MTKENHASYAIEAKGITKTFGYHPALKDIDLNVIEGESLIIFGPNGAGKTTLIKVLATLSKPTDGELRLAGMDIKKEAVLIRQKIGMVSHQTFLYDNLTAYENLKFFGRMYDVPNLEQRITEVIAQVELKDRLHDRVGVLSRGMQQRLSIARAMLHNPQIILLDEPETGLDQHANAMLNQLLKALRPGNQTVIMTTHNLALGLALGDRVMILHKGRIAYEDSLDGMELPDLQENYNRCTGAEL